MGFIYKITNDINDKVYIGQTVATIEHRWKQHLRAAFIDNVGSHLYHAMRKYGQEHFFVLKWNNAMMHCLMSEKCFGSPIMILTKMDIT
jgi:group I intron endonuclease